MTPSIYASASRLILFSLFLLFTVGCKTSVPDPAALDFMTGTWATVKDGLSLTVSIAPGPEGEGLIETVVVDDGNRATTTAEIFYDATAGLWIQRLHLADGATSEFHGTLSKAGQLELEQVSYNGKAIVPSQSRIVYAVGEADQMIVDWQSRDADGNWEPRNPPYLYNSVERPAGLTGEGRIAFISNREDNWNIYTMKPDGSDLQALTMHDAGDHYPVWIGGNRRIAFRSQRARDDGGWDRWEIDLDGTDAAQIDLPGRLQNPDLGMFPELHPSGSYIINAAEREGEQDIYVWRFDGSGERVVAPAKGLDYRPLFSPDGKHILFISERDGNAEVYTVAFDGSNVQRLTSNPGIDRYARWSPDGRQIGFVSDRDGDLEVFVMDVDGANVRQLTFNEAEDGEISWSPDGNRIAYRSDASGNGEINVVDVSSGAITNLTNSAAYEGEPAWSH